MAFVLTTVYTIPYKPPLLFWREKEKERESIKERGWDVDIGIKTKRKLRQFKPFRILD